MDNERRLFWPLIAASLVLASAAATLAALAVEDPVQPWPSQGAFSGDVGRCLSLLNLLSPGGDPLDRSDVPLLIGSAFAALACAITMGLAARRR